MSAPATDTKTADKPGEPAASHGATGDTHSPTLSATSAPPPPPSPTSKGKKSKSKSKSSGVGANPLGLDAPPATTRKHASSTSSARDTARASLLDGDKSDSDESDAEAASGAPKKYRAGTRHDVNITVRTEAASGDARRDAALVTEHRARAHSEPSAPISAPMSTASATEPRSGARDVLCACCCLKTVSQSPCQGKRACVCASVATLLALTFGIIMVVLLTAKFSVGPPSGDDVVYVRVKHEATIENSTGPTNGHSTNTTIQITYENISWDDFLNRKGLKFCMTNK